tara:strand:- start:134 stop:640 length:507 start_codon:yes stop_codon:yes gene_type:complete
MFFNSSHSNSQTFYDFNIESITGDNIDLSQYKDKVVLLVNTASKCGFTPQYAGLQKLYDKYKADGFVVLGVPSNDFNQELGNDADVKDFCEIRYGVNFPLTSIQKIKGSNAHPLYKWISNEASVIAQPRWNFHKFLIGKNGEILNWFSSMTSPSSTGFITQIEDAIFN